MSKLGFASKTFTAALLLQKPLALLVVKDTLKMFSSTTVSGVSICTNSLLHSGESFKVPILMHKRSGGKELFRDGKRQRKGDEAVAQELPVAQML